MKVIRTKTCRSASNIKDMDIRMGAGNSVSSNSYQGKPETGLMAAMLYQAILDLFNPKQRRDALRWFLRPTNLPRPRISYEDCCTHLCCDQARLKRLVLQLVDWLEKDDNNIRHGEVISFSKRVRNRRFMVLHNRKEEPGAYPTD